MEVRSSRVASPGWLLGGRRNPFLLFEALLFFFLFYIAFFSVLLFSPVLRPACMRAWLSVWSGLVWSSERGRGGGGAFWEGRERRLLVGVKRQGGRRRGALGDWTSVLAWRRVR